MAPGTPMVVLLFLPFLERVAERMQKPMVLNVFSFSNALGAKWSAAKFCAGAVNGEKVLFSDTGLWLLFRTWAPLGGPWAPKSYSDSATPLKPTACLYDRIDQLVFAMFYVWECSLIF